MLKLRFEFQIPWAMIKTMKDSTDEQLGEIATSLLGVMEVSEGKGF